MGREYGQLRHDLWSDDDWRSLTVPAQHLYMVLLSDPRLNYCGVAPWQPASVAQRSGENPTRATILAAAELSNRFFVVIDEEVGEVMVRSYLRHDPLLKNPRLAVTMAKDFATVGSNKIRAAVVHELTRLKRENTDWPAWEKPQVKTVLRQNAVSAKDMDTDLPMAAAQYLGVGLPSGMGNGDFGFTQPLQQQLATSTTTETRTTDLSVSNGAGYPHQASVTSLRGIA